jgi:hypothetical protein
MERTMSLTYAKDDIADRVPGPTDAQPVSSDACRRPCGPLVVADAAGYSRRMVAPKEANAPTKKDNCAKPLPLTHRQRHALAPLLEAIRGTLAIFGGAAEAGHTSPGIYLETARWARILEEFDEKG